MNQNVGTTAVDQSVEKKLKPSKSLKVGKAKKNKKVFQSTRPWKILMTGDRELKAEGRGSVRVKGFGESVKQRNEVTEKKREGDDPEGSGGFRMTTKDNQG